MATVGNQVAEPANDPSVEAAADPAVEPAGTSRFQVTLTNFTGPFDLLLQLISKHKLDVTEVALHKVTDEFIAYIRAMGDDWDLDEASEFLVVAATLLDLKAARLLPAAAVEDEEDLALLEARDLLFARLLQYKAFKEAAAVLATLSETGARRWPRAVRLEPQYAEALPDLVLGIGPARLAELAARALAPKQPPAVSISHVHMVRVSVREHAALLREKLMQARVATFRVLCADCQSTLEVVARFLALLELYRQGVVAFEQVEALGELTVRWTAAEDTGSADVQIDEFEGTQAESEPGAESGAESQAGVEATAQPQAGVEPAAESERASVAAAEPGSGPAPEPTDGEKRDE
ncbi:segregation and condensation protein A [Rugosimonospora africana]|uniref:segregation and condensation protein A n=1 Tax=Rugosimonospora africana TaxID=556532 RepID=UPI00194364FF